jgi:hypothetical protein
MLKIEQFFKNIQAAKVISHEIAYSEYQPLNLSVTNTDLQNHKLETAQDYEVFIQNQLDLNHGKIMFGGLCRNS